MTMESLGRRDIDEVRGESSTDDEDERVDGRMRNNVFVDKEAVALSNNVIEVLEI